MARKRASTINREPPRMMGRPKRHTDPTIIQVCGGCGAIQCTLKETAAVLGYTAEGLSDVFKRLPEARDAYEDGLDVGKMSLRRAQFKLAESNATMAIFLGKNYLDQKDKQEIATPETIKHEHTHAHALVPTVVDLDELRRLSPAELTRRLQDVLRGRPLGLPAPTIDHAVEQPDGAGDRNGAVSA